VPEYKNGMSQVGSKEGKCIKALKKSPKLPKKKKAAFPV
jgi:hypothetical protein